MAAKRIRKEITDLARENLGDIKLAPNESNIFQWRAVLPGPAGSPYEGGVFEVDVRVPDDYPFSPPQLQFLTKVYHCNIASTGVICLDLLKTAWSPALSLYKVVLSLSSLLTDPNPGDPLVPAIAQEYKRNRKKHDETAREWVKLYALPKSSEPEPAAPPPPTRPASARGPRGAVSRAGTSSRSATPPRAVTGVRRREDRGSGLNNAIDLLSDDDDDVEVLGESSTNGNAAEQPPRRSKRARVASDSGGGGGEAGGSGEVIVVDD
ncbi:Ubiquitin-conjugating enzyme E2 D4 [Vanrija pseudolonga]|uniref:Ubiquitin-conjugating enzyme E2 D4 n=1 Tax=Vanrija pseudolonga TaxID=143232 RepID=A0AAF0Y073_9TREE|nr:Ubiquitin-conjugating enzyme E2 D4 [Vanrija pseudolonga]